jgi:hypothetical protein
MLLVWWLTYAGLLYHRLSLLASKKGSWSEVDALDKVIAAVVGVFDCTATVSVVVGDV